MILVPRKLNSDKISRFLTDVPGLGPAFSNSFFVTLDTNSYEPRVHRDILKVMLSFTFSGLAYRPLAKTHGLALKCLGIAGFFAHVFLLSPTSVTVICRQLPYQRAKLNEDRQQPKESKNNSKFRDKKESSRCNCLRVSNSISTWDYLKKLSGNLVPWLFEIDKMHATLQLDSKWFKSLKNSRSS